MSGRWLTRGRAVAGGALVIAVLLLNHGVVLFVRRVIENRQFQFLDASAVGGGEGLVARAKAASPADPAPPRPVVPFEEVDVLDEDADSWSTPFAHGGAGLTVADFNGDGLLDLYFVRDGQNWTRPTDAEGVLEDQPRRNPNLLYLHQGNDERGDPRFARLDQLAARNDTWVEEELLIEDCLVPRRATSEPRNRAGRSGNAALAADFNGDGRPDLLVGNAPTGMFWSHEKTSRVLPRFVAPVGREARHSRVPLASLGTYLIKDYQPRQSIHDFRDSSRGREPEGANSLYLNLGDRDQDGLPEWRDVSRESGIEGCRPTLGMAAADVDLDGDLDFFTANVMDFDFWPGGSRCWAGGANGLYLNQLYETGELRFVECAAEMGVDGVFDADYPMPEYHRIQRLPWLPAEYSLLRMKPEAYHPDPMVLDGQVAEQAEISWACVFQDVNDDGYPDLWVANDMGLLRLHLNQKGERFVTTTHARSDVRGNWMTLAPVDLDQDLQEDLFAGNLGGAMMNHAFVGPDPFTLLDPVLSDGMAYEFFFTGSHDPTHAILDGGDLGRELPHRVHHSRILPPDTTLTTNRARRSYFERPPPPFEPDTIDAYEFAWGVATLDVQNDGRMDLYYLGCLFGRGGGLFPVVGTGPGRLLVQETMADAPVTFRDLTVEHHVLNIEELRYDRLESHGYVYRPAPSQNWRKRDVVYSHDRSTWVSQGVLVQERVTNQDLIQVAEDGRGVVAADLDGNGFQDLILTNLGGYDSRSSRARNLRARIDGRAQVVPAPDFNYPTLTSFEPGPTQVFLNRYGAHHWIKVRLVGNAPNGDAIGARVTINGRYLRVKRAGGGGFVSNTLTDLHFGLGDEKASSVEIIWPDRARSVTRQELDSLAEGLLVMSPGGVVEWVPWTAGATDQPPG